MAFSIIGSDAAGVFYGIQSLRSMIPIEAYQNKSSSFSVPHVIIEDAPRFGFRGLHLDVSRNFQTKETILRVLDLLSFYKINRFLFYTTEDEGWRLEIKDLPELTEVGAQREHTSGRKRRCFIRLMAQAHLQRLKTNLVMDIIPEKILLKFLNMRMNDTSKLFRN